MMEIAGKVGGFGEGQQSNLSCFGPSEEESTYWEGDSLRATLVIQLAIKGRRDDELVAWHDLRSTGGEIGFEVGDELLP